MINFVCVLLFVFLPTLIFAQRANTFVLGSLSTPWRYGGNGIDPKVFNKGKIDTTNSPDYSIEYNSQ